VFQVRQLDRRILEVSKLGFRTCVVPKVAQKAFKACAEDTVKLIPCATLQEVVTEVILQLFPA
jgi:DNA repair protein RadA/Sms